jgi:predicted nucleic acid-binding protein
MMIRVVLADANELIPRITRDYLVYLATAGAFDLRWSVEIWNEVRRNLIKKAGFDDLGVSKLSFALDSALPMHLVRIQPDFDYIASLSGADSKDTHVVAAAMSAHADILLTENLTDFPTEWLGKRSIKLLDLGGLLERIADTNPVALRDAHARTLATSRLSERQVLHTLEQVVGKQAKPSAEMPSPGIDSVNKARWSVAPEPIFTAFDESDMLSTNCLCCRYLLTRADAPILGQHR